MSLHSPISIPYCSAVSEEQIMLDCSQMESIHSHLLSQKPTTFSKGKEERAIFKQMFATGRLTLNLFMSSHLLCLLPQMVAETKLQQ